MNCMESEMGTIKQILGNLNLQERNYLKYLRAKERGRAHWALKRYRKLS